MTTGIAIEERAELERRNRADLGELARRRLSSFCEYTGEGRWVHSPHLDLLCEKIEEAERWTNEGHDEIKLIVVSAPPRHGKSEAVSRNAPAWFLGRNPDKEVILAAHTASLATDMSREARRIFRDYAGPLFGLELSQDTQSVELWHVAGHSGKMQAAGAGGPLMGRGGSLVIIEDPHKSLEEAESPTYQRKILEWFKSTIVRSLAPSGAIVIVASRLHTKDLIGQLLEEAEISGLVWEMVEFPAIAGEDDPLRREEGAALWPWRFNEKRLAQIRALLASERIWLAQYQQRPTPDVEGALWKLGLIDALRIGEGQMPELYRTAISWDPSTTSKKTSDEHGIYVLSVGAPYYASGEGSTIGELDTKHGYVRDNLSGIYTPDEATRIVIDAYHRYGAGAVVAEDNQGGDWIETAVRLRDPDVSYHGITASESKKGRAEPVSALYSQRRIHHVGVFTQLEKELTTYTGPPMPSPNQLDAVVHGFAELFDLAKTRKERKPVGVW